MELSDRVEINIKDNKRFADVALLIDKPEFIKDVKVARGTPTFPRYLSKYISKYKPKVIKKQEFSHKAIKDLIKIYEKSLKLRKKYKRPAGFERVISAAIIKNKVDERDYRDAYATILDPKHYYFKETDMPKLAILLNPNTTRKEIEEIYSKELPRLREVFSNILVGIPNDVFPKDVLSTIKRDRHWYWLYKNHVYGGWTPLSKYLRQPVATVRTAVGNYEKRLKQLL